MKIPIDLPAISHGADDDVAFSLTLTQASNSDIHLQHHIKPSIACGRRRSLEYDESCDLMNYTKVGIEFAASSKKYTASFVVDLDQISLLPDAIVVSSECRTQEVFHTPLVNSKATSVVRETPYDFSRNHSVADDPDATPTKRKDVSSDAMDGVGTDPGLHQLAGEAESILQNVTNSAKRKADPIEDWHSTKRSKTVQKTYGQRNRKTLSSLSRMDAEESNDPASGKQNAVAERKKASKTKPTDSAEGHTSTGKRPSRRAAENSNRQKDKQTVPASQDTAGSSASPLSTKTKLAIVFSGSKFATDKAAVAFLKRNVRILDAVSDKVDYLCVGHGELKTTSKILTAVAHGMKIISDEWVRQCLQREAILEPSKFLAEDENAEQQLDVPATWSRGTNRPSADLFGGRTVYMTPMLKKSYGSGFGDLKSLVKLLGARDLTSFPVANNSEIESDNYIALGLGAGDTDSFNLFQNAVPVYHKDLISVAILRGRLDLGGEFRFDAVQGKEAKRGKK